MTKAKALNKLDKFRFFDDLGYKPHPGQVEVHKSTDWAYAGRVAHRRRGRTESRIFQLRSMPSRSRELKRAASVGVRTASSLAFAGKRAAGESTQVDRAAHRIAIDGPCIGDRHRLPLQLGIERKVDRRTLDRSGQVRFAEVR